MTDRGEVAKCFFLVAGLTGAWALVVCRALAALSPDYAATPSGAGLTRVPAYLAAGFVVGLLVTAAARLGKRTRRPASSLIAPTLLALALTTGLVAAGCVAGAVLEARNVVTLPDDLATRVPARRHGVFVVALAGHLALGTLFPVAGVQAGAVWLSRKRGRRLSMTQQSPTMKG